MQNCNKIQTVKQNSGNDSTLKDLLKLSCQILVNMRHFVNVAPSLLKDIFSYLKHTQSTYDPHK